jgi:hypothetical protein
MNNTPISVAPDRADGVPGGASPENKEGQHSTSMPASAWITTSTATLTRLEVLTAQYVEICSTPMIGVMNNISFIASQHGEHHTWSILSSVFCTMGVMLALCRGEKMADFTHCMACALLLGVGVLCVFITSSTRKTIDYDMKEIVSRMNVNHRYMSDYTASRDFRELITLVHAAYHAAFDLNTRARDMADAGPDAIRALAEERDAHMRINGELYNIRIDQQSPISLRKLVIEYNELVGSVIVFVRRLETLRG